MLRSAPSRPTSNAYARPTPNPAHITAAHTDPNTANCTYSSVIDMGRTICHTLLMSKTLMPTRFSIVFAGRTHTFVSLFAATRFAERIFAAKGIVVGIEAI